MYIGSTMAWNMVFQSLLMLYLVTWRVASLNNFMDESALLAFKSQITHDANNILTSNWSEGVSYCNWIGIICDRRHQRVIGLNLSNLSLGGTIINGIGMLSALQHLDLSYNAFTGSIPNEIGNLSALQQLNLDYNALQGDLPSTVFNISFLLKISIRENKISGKFPEHPCNRATKLESIELSGNQFHGEIPLSLLHCRALTVLNISNNRFLGSIPSEIGNLTALQRLDLRDNYLRDLEFLHVGNNSINGAIPQKLGHLSSLNWLDLSLNKFEGEIPESIFNVSRLQVLNLYHNNLSGNLPSLAPRFPDLTGLYVSSNRLSGEIPSSISNFSKLTVLELSSNSFSGRVPMTLGNLLDLEILHLAYNPLTNDPSTLELDFLIPLKNCRQLRIIWIGNNSFDGMLPKALGNFSASLEIFYAYYCGIKGIIPSEIGNMSNLFALDIGGNDLIGTIPDTLGELRKLQVLQLDGNKLQGPIPVTFCNLTNLYVLKLKENNLSEQIPSCFGNLTSLREIHLSYNSLTSIIPSTLWTNKEIQIMDLSYNFLSGSLAPAIGSVASMIVLNLSGNQFSGDIPSTIGKLERLEILTLSSNNLLGHIPESFGNLVALKYLDLSQNNLCCVIPKSLEKLQDLVYFNVSFNELNGEIPNGGPFKNLTADYFIGNGELCGASQFKVMPCKDNKTRSSSKIRVLKYILPSVISVASLSVIMVCLMRHCNRNTARPAQSSPPIMVKRISYYEVLKSTNNFDEENLIGRGSFGSVYKGVFSDGTIYVIKAFNLDLEGMNKSFDTECQILCNIRHRNLVKVISCCSNLDLKALVLEYMPNGNLKKLLYSSNYCLNISQRLEIMIDVASALEYLHHYYPSQVVHCDLNPSNILLDEDMVAHVGDFGISKLFTEDQRISHTKTLGTIGYMAPEYGSTGLISTMADVYSYGIMLMETSTKKKPTDDIFVEELTMRKWVFELYPDSVMQIIDVDLVDGVEANIKAKESCLRSIMGLALECTTDMPEERLDMKNVLIRLKKIKTEFLSNITGEE